MDCNFPLGINLKVLRGDCIFISIFLITAGLSHQKNMKKMRILTIMSIGSEKSEVSFEELSKTIDINIEDVENFVIDGEFELEVTLISSHFLFPRKSCHKAFLSPNFS